MKRLNLEYKAIDENYLQSLSQLYEFETIVTHPSARLKGDELSRNNGGSVLPKDSAAVSRHLYPGAVKDSLGCGMALINTNLKYSYNAYHIFNDIFKSLADGATSAKINVNRVFNNPVTLPFLGHDHPLVSAGIFNLSSSIPPAQWISTLKNGVPGYFKARSEFKIAKKVSQVFENGGNHISAVSDKKFYSAVKCLRSSWKRGLILRNSDIGNDTYFRGNHFLELQNIQEIIDPKIANLFGLKENLLCLLMHTHGNGFSSALREDIYNFYFKPLGKVVFEKDPFFDIFFTIKDILKAQSAIQRAIVLHRILSIAKEKKNDVLQNMDLSPITESSHNDVFLKGGNVMYLRDCNLLYRDRLSIVAGNFDGMNYLVRGGEKMDDCLGTICHGLAHALPFYQTSLLQYNSNLIIRKNRFLPPFRLRPRFRTQNVVLKSSEYSDEILSRLQDQGFIEVVAKLRPLLTLKYEKPYSKFEYLAYQTISRRKSVSHY